MEKESERILNGNPLDQEVLISFYHETLVGFFCIFSDGENVLKKFPGLVSRRHFIEF